MILCLQTLFPLGTILLTTDSGEVRGAYTWEKTTKNPNLISEIASLLQRENIFPQSITKLSAVQGPGPFTAVRTVAVIARTWKAEHPDLELNAIPSGVFLRHKFPEAQELILPAGKNAFFRFNPDEPEYFTKHPLVDWRDLNSNCGGFFDPSWPTEFQARFILGRSDHEAFSEFAQKKSFTTENEFLPIYGAEAHISRSS